MTFSSCRDLFIEDKFVVFNPISLAASGYPSCATDNALQGARASCGSDDVDNDKDVSFRVVSLDFEEEDESSCTGG
jgi:hypothetical protein